MRKANVALSIDELGIGPAAVRQAKKLGAKAFVHYSIPSQITRTLFINIRDLIEQECEKLGVEFIDTTVLDPTSDHGLIEAREFILKNVSETVDEYGKDTAFFVANESLEPSLFSAVLEVGAICPHFSRTYNTYVEALAYAFDLEIGDNKNEEVLMQAKELLNEMNMLGRISSWADEYVFPLTIASADYAVKWINGEVPKEGVDREVLTQLISDYVGVQTYLTPYIDVLNNRYSFADASGGSGEIYDNYLLMRMDYITVEEEL